MSIGEFIKKVRVEKKMSINQLALYSQVSAAHISRIERGLREPSPEILRKISTALKVRYEELLKIAGYLDKDTTTLSDTVNITIGEKKIGNTLKTLREEKKLSQVELAKKLNITSQSLSQYELSKRAPNIDMINKLADFFNVSIDYILGRTDIKQPINEIVENSKQNKNSTNNSLFEELQNLSPESQKELKKLIELYKIKDMQDKNTEFSDEISKPE